MGEPRVPGGHQQVMGSRGTTASPENPQKPFRTPGPQGVADGSIDSVNATGGIPSQKHPFIVHWKEFLIAQATDQYLTQSIPFEVPDFGLTNNRLLFGQDITHGTHGAQRRKNSVADNEQELRTKMRRLVSIFGTDDDTGMVERLFDRFLERNRLVEIFEDEDMNEAMGKHANFIAFSDRVLAAPGTPGANPNKIRIHQALKRASWDIAEVPFIDDLGILAFNLGSSWRRTGDFAEGLAVMINGVQYVLVYCEWYAYNAWAGTYDIQLRFVLYDVFGLDDDDMDEYGAESDWNMFSAAHGITAWWQLQHCYNYAPLVTRGVVTRTFRNIPAI